MSAVPPPTAEGQRLALWAVRRHDHARCHLFCVQCVKSKAVQHAHAPPLLGIGAPVTPFEHNWVVLLRVGGYVCGASLIDEQWAMTAAHCTEGLATSVMQVGVHRHAYGWADNGEHDCAETVAIAEKVEHPDYNYENNYENDISLLRLSQVCNLSLMRPGRRRHLPYDNLRPIPRSARANVQSRSRSPGVSPCSRVST